MKNLTKTILAFIVLFSIQTFGQIGFSNFKKAVTTNISAIPTLFNGYAKEHIDKTGIVYYGNRKNSNTIAINRKQGSNIVFYGFDNKTHFIQIQKEIEKIGVQNGCDIRKNIDTEIDTPLEIECECDGYFYYLKTLSYNNIIAGYELKISKSINKKYIVDEDSKVNANVQNTNNEISEKNTKKTNESVENDSVKLVAIEKNAEYKGGNEGLLKYISDNLIIPDDLDYSGSIVVNFNVKTNGDAEISNIDGYCPEIIKESLNKLFKKMPKWKPAELKDGTLVKEMRKLPLKF